MKRISVVTVNYNTEDATKNLLKSLEKTKTTGFDLKIIVVDNGSSKPIDLEKKQSLELIRLENNTGFTGGYNTGIKKALENGADFILILNNDTIVNPNLILELQKIIESDGGIGVAVPKIYFAKGYEFHKDRYEKRDLGKIFWYAGGYIDWDNVRSVHRGVDEVDHGQYNEVEKIEFASGCCMMFKKEVLEKVGFFDERYFLYYEDADLSERIKRAGYKIYYAPKAVLHHLNASSSGGAGRGNELQDYFITRNQMLFGFSYAPLRSKIALIRQSIKLLINGRAKQKQAIHDFYLGRLHKGSFFEK